MEVEDKVQIRRADLERYVASEAMEPTETVPEPEKKALLQSKVPALLLRMARSTLPRPLAVCRRPKKTSINSSRIFTERQLAQFSGWQLWSHLLWRSLLNGSCSFLPFLFLFWFLMIIFFWPRIAKDVKKILSELENCFLGLAECQHTLESKGKTEDFDAMLQKAKEAARQPSLGFPIHIFQHLFQMEN